jgi:predicted nucleotidyltransferase
VHDPRVDLIVRAVLAWAKAQPRIRAIALVGSRARGAARPDSDIDLVLLVTDSRAFRADTTWIEQIDWKELDQRPEKWQDEDYGMAWSRRIWLTAASVQVELTFAPLFWAKVDPPDAGTRGVITGGCRILHDPDGLLVRLCAAVNQ